MSDQSIIQRAIVAVRYLYNGSMPQGWFGPNNPLPPQAPPEVAGRAFDYRIGANLDSKPRTAELVGFDKLKALARHDTVRIVMEGQKDKIEALDWSIKVRERDGKKGKADASVIEIQRQLEYPDRVHDWGQWVRALLEQNFVLDALSIYRRRDRGGRPYAFEIIDGSTIKPLLDQSGRQPVMPDASYQQVLKGLPAVNYTTAELLYFPQNYRVDHVYGYSRVEQIVDTVETAIQRLKSQKAFFTHGNLSDGFFTAPPDTTPDQIGQVEKMWNNLLTASIENRRKNQFLPSGFVWNAIGQPPLQEAFDEWLARIICFCFSTAPTPFLKQQGLGQGSATTEHEAAEAAGLGNMMGYIRRVMNRILAEDFARPDLEFAWTEDREFDPEVKARIEDMRVKNGTLTRDEVRDRNGDDPLPDGIGAVPTVDGSPTRLEDAVAEPEEVPPELLPGAVPGAPQPGDDAKPKGKGEDAEADDAAKGDLAKAAPRTAERRLAAALNRYFAGKAREIASLIEERFPLEKAVDDGFERALEGVFEEIDWSWSDLPKLIEPLLVKLATGAGKLALQDLGLFSAETRSRLVRNAAEFAENRAAQLIGRKLVDGELVDNGSWSISATTRDMVRKAVTNAVEEGASNQDLARVVRESGAFSKARAITIARSETAIADTQGAYAGWRASGVVAGKEWLASADCCEDCALLDGEIVGLDDDFTGGADVPLHPNCECAVSPVLPEDMPGGEPADDA
jgi:SPP1 gp7 family putative phage head morphogenesis protein